MTKRFGVGVLSKLLGAAASGALIASPAFAQQQPQPQPLPLPQSLPQSPSSADLDPSAPLDPMPGLGVAWPDLGQEQPGQPLDGGVATPSTGAAASDSKRFYRIAIDGLERIGNAQQLVDSFEQQSALYEGRRKQANIAQIQRRSDDDSGLLAQLLRSQGYYDAIVEPVTASEGALVRVTLEATPGEQYRFQSVELPGLDRAGENSARLRESFAVKAGDAVIAQDVLAADVALKVALGEQGFALAKIGDQAVVVDHRTHLASLVLPVEPGPVARFGTIRVSGRPPFSARHVAEIARFRPGDRFERRRVDDLRRALIATGLVGSTEVKVIPLETRGIVDLDVSLTPAPTHTIAGELGYGTGEGAKLDVSWQDRNFINPEGALTVHAIAGTREQLAGVEFRRSNFGKRDRVLDVQLDASHSFLDAYQARTVRFLGSIERQSNIIWRKTWTWGIGAEFLATDELGVFDDPSAKETRTFLISALPLSLAYDRSNDLLDPTRGFRISGHLSPEISAKGGSFAYARAQVDASAYYPATSRIVLAGRLRLGSIFGADAPSIAPSRRFYAGGGGSVRGYGYQRVGPQDFAGDPVGGKTLTEFSLEARYRFGNFGIVPFFDGGALTNKVTPTFNGWQFGAGLGIRYYSSFGPIRLDVATPLNPRPGDGPVAVAVSIGQAF